MRKNPVLELNSLYNEYANGRMDRRTLLKAAGGLGLAAGAYNRFAMALPASAQDATPTGVGFTSMTREEYKARLAEDYSFTAETPPEPGGTVIFGSLASSNLTTFNPVFADNFPTQDFNFLIFESLIGNYPHSGADIAPGLADYFTVAEDGKTYTFYLNPNAVFHDGTPLTSADVIFTIESVMNETLPTSYLQGMLDTVASARAIDDHTVEVVLVDVLALIVFASNFFAPIVPKHIWEGVALDAWQTDPGSTGQDPARVIGSGPFKFVETNESEGTSTFARWENYWDGPPVMETLIFQTWPDDASAIEALRTGAIDFYDAVPPSEVEGLRAEEGIEVETYETYLFNWMGFNLDPEKTPLFQDLEVRQALYYGLDRQSMAENIWFDLATVADGPQPVLSEAFAPDQINTHYTYDVAKANELLDGAGWVVGDDGIREKDGNKLSFEIMYGISSTNDLMAAAAQDFWSELGVEATPNPVDFDTVVVPAITENFDFTMVMLAFNWASPNGTQDQMFGTEFYGAGFNAMKYSNPEVDRLYDEADRTLDPEARKALLIEASNYVNDEVPAIILFYRQGRTGYSERMINFVPTANSFLWSLPFVQVAE